LFSAKPPQHLCERRVVRQHSELVGKLRSELFDNFPPSSAIEKLSAHFSANTKKMSQQQLARKIAEQSSLLSYGTPAPRIEEFVERVTADRRVAIIGAAGRLGDAKLLSEARFNWVVEKCAKHTTAADHLLSGGAAFADHAAVVLALRRGNRLTLELPAEWDSARCRFSEVTQEGLTSNHYHRQFSRACGWPPDHSLQQLNEVMLRSSTEVRVSGNFFQRNNAIAVSCELLLAFTFQPQEPNSGGTGNTWKKCRHAQKRHFQIK
jgi:hypothetical protein